MLRHDTAQHFCYATAQSQIGQDLYRALRLPTTAFETNLVISNGAIYQRLDAFAAAMQALPMPWRFAAQCRRLPQGLKDALYLPIARNRYRLFGRYDACIIPDAGVKSRFVPGGGG